jgi:hypothetical protein
MICDVFLELLCAWQAAEQYTLGINIDGTDARLFTNRATCYEKLKVIVRLLLFCDSLLMFCRGKVVVDYFGFLTALSRHDGWEATTVVGIAE